MNNVYKITLNANNATPVVTTLVFKQGDKGQKLDFVVEELDRTGATSTVIAFMRANGTSVEGTLTATATGYEYTIQGNEFGVPGRVVADLKFYQGNTGRVSTTSFIFGVYSDTLDGLGGGAGGYSDVLEQLRDEAEAARQSFLDATAEAMIYAQRAEEAAEQAMSGTPEGYSAVVAQVEANTEAIAEIQEAGSPSEVNIQELKLLGWTVPRECPVQNEINGNVFTQKVGRVDLGTLSWSYAANVLRFSTGTLSSTKKPGYVNMACAKYTVSSAAWADSDRTDKVITGAPLSNGTIYIRDFSYTNATSLKQSLQGQYLYYELATPITYSIADDGLDFDNAGAHNCRCRNKFLGNAVTAEQYAAIADGTFRNLYPGDYWTIGGINYRIMGFDYYLNCGDVNTTEHHAVIVPDTALYTAQMNETNTTTGAYVGSKMYTEGLEQAKNTIKTAFSGHVLKHRIYLNNATSNGRVSAGGWYDSEVDLMNEQMVYGCSIFSPVSDGTNVPANYRVEKSQLPLFALEPSRIAIRANWWLRDAIAGAYFVHSGSGGGADYSSASVSFGVRPAFCIY